LILTEDQLKALEKVREEKEAHGEIESAKLYDRKNALVAADTLNDKIIPWVEEEEIHILRYLNG
jgi:hypothetical protein